jgi:hypothetical protein
MLAGSLPPGWAMLVAGDGKQYFYHAKLGITQWDRPTAGDAAGATAALPPGWAEITTDDGRLYFYHTETKLTQWNRPLATSVPAAPEAPQQGSAAALAAAAAAAAAATEGDDLRVVAETTAPLSSPGAPTEPSPPWVPGAAAELVRRDYLEDLEDLVKEEAELMSHFEEIDVHRTGIVTAEAMERYVRSNYLDMPTGAITAAFEAQDLDGDGRISLR